MRGPTSGLLRLAALAAALLVSSSAIELHAPDHRHDLGRDGRDAMVAREAAHPAAPHHFEAADETLARACACALSSHRPALAAPAAVAISFSLRPQPYRRATPTALLTAPLPHEAPRGPPAA